MAKRGKSHKAREVEKELKAKVNGWKLPRSVQERHDRMRRIMANLEG